MANLATLGGVTFHSTNIEVGGVPRALGVSTNALAPEPVQTVDYISDFMQVRIDGMFKPPNAQYEYAALKAEVAKDTNTLTTPDGSYRVFKNNPFAINYELHSSVSGLIYFSVTLNCLP